METQDLLKQITAFRDKRDWKQFHKPQQLAAAISIEAAELQQHFLWKSPTESVAIAADESKRAALAEEAADILIFALLLAEQLGLDPAEIIMRKLAKNEARYPISKARGSSAKYTEF